VAVNVTLVAPEKTLTKGGVETAEGELLDRTTLEPVVEAPERMTVQAVEAGAVRIAWAHCREVTVIGASVILRVMVWLAPFKVAVMFAF
jgi:hypothetical protein